MKWTLINRVSLRRKANTVRMSASDQRGLASNLPEVCNSDTSIIIGLQTLLITRGQ
jgi:hypothetical protein